MKICYDQRYRHWSCHSNEMTPLPILLAAVFLSTGNHTYIHSPFIILSGRFSAIGTNWGQNRLRERFPPIAASIFVKYIEIFWNEVFMVRNAVKLDHL